MNTPLKPEDMNRFAGQMTKAESSMFDLLPSGATIAVGGDYQKETSIRDTSCHLCDCRVYIDFRDDRVLQNEKAVVWLCPTCYFKMEPKEAE